MTEQRNNIILLNGPPASGKDVIAEKILSIVDREIMDLQIQAYHMQFKKRLFDIALSITGINSDVWFERYGNRKLKEEPWDRLPINYTYRDVFDGDLVEVRHTQRTWLVEVSENIIKPRLGLRFFGDAAAQKIIEDQSCDIMKLSGWGHLHVFSDSGFSDEVIPLADIPNTDIHLIQLYRDGCSFAGDSRRYLDDSNKYATFHDICNDGTIEQAAREILNITNIYC